MKQYEYEEYMHVIMTLVDQQSHGSNSLTLPNFAQFTIQAILKQDIQRKKYPYDYFPAFSNHGRLYRA